MMRTRYCNACRGVRQVKHGYCTGCGSKPAKAPEQPFRKPERACSRCTDGKLLQETSDGSWHCWSCGYGVVCTSRIGMLEKS